MKIVCIADTHGLHEKVELPEGDVLIHAGDLTGHGTPRQLMEFVDWLALQPFEYKVVVAGNHDAYCELHPEHAKEVFQRYDIIYLNNEWAEIEGLKFWGSPWTPTFNHWHFMATGTEITEHWRKIPDDTDVLITHGPPKGILDRVVDGRHEGCPHLRARVEEIQPRLHVFGHIHEAYGEEGEWLTRFVNASLVDWGYNLVNEPVVVSFPTSANAICNLTEVLG